jgi:uncharacterized protein YlxW (UPF0749 family)
MSRVALGRLATAARPRATRGQLVAAVLCAALGFGLAVQVRSNQVAGLSTLSQSDLVRILDDVSQRTARLQAESRDLEDTRAAVTGGASGSRAALQEARARTRTLGILAGTVPATGPGIEFTITDPKNHVHADVLLDALEELRDAGAEAVEISSVGGEQVRVVVSTHLVDAAGGIQVDGTLLHSPYHFRVIGDPRTLAAALDIPGGVLDVLHQEGATGVVAQQDSLTITSLRPAPRPQYAHPAQESGR